ncbi:MAG TPA: hypothetical protein VF070_31575, partial [Streptosporangiaceae bacterium]
MGDQPAGNSGARPAAPPGVTLAGQLQATAGAGERYPGAGDDTVVVAAGRWDAVESWAAARKLAAIRELIRRRPAEGYEPGTARAPAAAPAPGSAGTAAGPPKTAADGTAG